MTSDTSPSSSSGAETEAVAQPAPAPPLRFNSLVDIQAAHLDLLKTSRAKAPADRRAAILQFVETARNSGALLDTFEDRVAAQDILDYWGSSLYADASLRGQYGDADDAVNTALEPFDEHAVDDVARAAQDAVQRSLVPGERDIAMRMLMRLMRLERGGRFHPVAVSKAELLSAVGEPAKVRHVLQVLSEAGVLRAVKDGEYVALSHESLSRKWDELHRLLRRRAEFRDAASFWKTAGKDRAALIRGKLLAEARSYHDLDQTERAFIDASSVKETEAVRVYRATAVVLLVLAVAAVIGWM